MSGRITQSQHFRLEVWMASAGGRDASGKLEVHRLGKFFKEGQCGSCSSRYRADASKCLGRSSKGLTNNYRFNH